MGKDHARGIVYLPDEDLARFGLSRADLPRHLGDERFRALAELETDRAHRLCAEALDLIPLVTTARGRAALQFAADASGAILEKIRVDPRDAITRRASLSVLETFALVSGSAWRARRAGPTRG